MADLDAIAARAEAATPGPWGWFGNIKHGSPYLATHHGGRVFVMQFARLGMAGGQPVFQVRDDPEHPEWGHMAKGADLAIYEVEHRADIIGFDNPDARFLAHARQDVDDLLDIVERLRALATEVDATREVGLTFAALDMLEDLSTAGIIPRRDGRCQQCGCTDAVACAGGCWWADPDRTLCSACAPKAAAHG